MDRRTVIYFWEKKRQEGEKTTEKARVVGERMGSGEMFTFRGLPDTRAGTKKGRSIGPWLSD